MIEAERTPGFLHLLQMTGGASWLHMCIHHRETEGFLSSATGLDKLIAAAMVSEDTRSRLRVHGQGVMVLLKAMHLRADGVGHPEDMVSMRITALSAIGTRPLRPGLQFTLDIANKPVDGLVVHLKAGCRSPQLDKPKRPSERDACPILAQQVPVIEKWIDDRVGRDFVLIGDFNRTLLRELEQFPQPDPGRFGSTPMGQAQWVAPEWNDNQPQGSTVTVIPHLKRADGALVAGDFFCAQTTGIDHVILSPALLQRLKPAKERLELLPAGYKLNGQKLPLGKTTVPPSDHCARFIRLIPKS